MYLFGFACWAVFKPLLFLSLLVWGLWIARSSKDGFGAMLAVGTVGCLMVGAGFQYCPLVLGVFFVIYRGGWQRRSRNQLIFRVSGQRRRRNFGGFGTAPWGKTRSWPSSRDPYPPPGAASGAMVQGSVWAMVQGSPPVR